MAEVSEEQQYFEANRQNWNDRAPIHASSATYSLDAYAADPDRISSTVNFDRRYLGDVTGLRAVHLQCHIGTDTLSLARLGAETTGVDQSADSLAAARRLSSEAGPPVTFVEANVYDAPAVLGQTFDLVYTGVGALNWLPSVARWADVVDQLLAPGGRLYLREGHPMLWAIDDENAGDGVPLQLRYPYFETETPMTFDEGTTYTENSADGSISHPRTYEWNHGLGEIITSLLDRGLTLDTFEEHRELEWKALPQMVETESGGYRMPDLLADMVPLMYTVVATKPARP